MRPIKNQPMKPNPILLLIFLITTFSFAQSQSEEIIYSFNTTNGKKVSIIKESKNAYIYYQFGKAGKTEMQFPRLKNATSWKDFKYNNYGRGGGKNNAGMEIANLEFENKGYKYLIFRAYFSETESITTGVIVTDLKTQKETRISGIEKSSKGSLISLDQNSPLIIEDIGLNF